MTNLRTYNELSRLETFLERYQYLRIGGGVGAETFGFDRWINQRFYNSREWKQARNFVILRDNGCDLGIPGREIHGALYIHHVNPISAHDIMHSDEVLNPEFLITTTHRTHNAIHFGTEQQLSREYVPRRRGDTRLW